MPDVLLDVFFRAANAFSSVLHDTNQLPPSPEVLYHYTTSSGLKGIIQSGEIWANCFGYMNDSAELLLGLEYTRAAVDYYESQLNLTGKPNRIQTDLVSLFRQGLDRRGRFDVFGCCFADDGDRLSQWRGYAVQGHGYAIGFRFERPDPQLTVKTILAQVIYDKEAQRLAAATMVNNVLTEVPQLVSEAEYDNSRDYVKTLMQLTIDLTFPQLKHKGFEEEVESRLIVSGEDVPEIGRPDDFLERNGILNPYIRLRPKDGQKLPIVKIVVGPCLDFERAEHSIRQLLEKYSYTGVDVERSKVPFLP